MKRFIICLVIMILPLTSYSQEISKEEQERKQLNEQFDKQHLREKTTFVHDSSETMLVKPADKKISGTYTVATVPPKVKLQILPDMTPEYFPEIDQYMVAWANWAYVARSDDNRFFMSASDHRGFGCNINLYEYNPGRDIVHTVLDVDELLGWTDKSYTDGKIHGKMGIMPDGTLWAGTHFGVHPDSSWFANGYRGSWLLSYNINTHEAKNWGVPLVGEMLPCFAVDTKRGRFVGTGAGLKVMCWDTINKTLRYGGYPPNGWLWHRRAMMLDEETGYFWSYDHSDPDVERFISFDPELNRFQRYDVTVPANPISGKVGQLRGHTERPAMDGWFYWSTKEGALFRFKPQGPDGVPVVDPLGVTWDDGKDTLQMALDPTGRYIYYYPKESSPIVQYDVKTGRKKALCWLQDFYFEKYGYYMDSPYGMEISLDGSFLVICMNGEFQGRGKVYGHPSIIVVEIPEEERPVD